MSLPPKVISVPANWFSSRDGQRIQCIIAHDTERPNNASNSIDYLKRGGSLSDGSDRKVSIHALFGDTGIQYQMVADEYAANHAGFGTLTLNGVTYGPPPRKYSINDISLGFELEYTKAPYDGAYPVDQLLSMGYWINQKRARYGQLPIYRHADVDPKRRQDTRNLTVAQIEHWAVVAAQIMSEIPTPQTPINYVARVDQVIYTDRSIDAPFAGDQLSPEMIHAGVTYAIGDITGSWAWIATGVGFVPKNTLKRAS